MIGVIKEDKADAISELNLFSKASDSHATFPLKLGNFYPPCTPSVALNDQFEINCFMIGDAIKEDKAVAISELHLFAKTTL
jgi:hypothetical protein